MWPQLISLSALFRGPVRPWLHNVRSDRQSQRIPRKFCWQTSSKLALICLYSSAVSVLCSERNRPHFVFHLLFRSTGCSALSMSWEVYGVLFLFYFFGIFFMCRLLLILTMHGTFPNCQTAAESKWAAMVVRLSTCFSLCHIPSLRVRCPFCVEFATL